MELARAVLRNPEVQLAKQVLEGGPLLMRGRRSWRAACSRPKLPKRDCAGARDGRVSVYADVRAPARRVHEQTSYRDHASDALETFWLRNRLVSYTVTVCTTSTSR